MNPREMLGPKLTDPEWMHRLWRAAEDAIEEGEGECRTNEVAKKMGETSVLDVAKGLRLLVERGRLVKVQEGLTYRWRMP